jgi:predicted SnoaL-like aldol condensation-catalyzing enzyme
MTTSNSTDANKALVLAGIKGVFIDRDPAVLDRLFSDDYRQHNPQIPNGTSRRFRRSFRPTSNMSQVLF